MGTSRFTLFTRRTLHRHPVPTYYFNTTTLKVEDGGGGADNFEQTLVHGSQQQDSTGAFPSSRGPRPRPFYGLL